MRYYDDYQELYNTQDDWYYEYVNRRLKEIRRKNNESKRVKQRNKSSEEISPRRP